MPNAFTLMGILPGAIRSYEEMAKINKEEADKAFKFHKKILGEYLTNCTSYALTDFVFKGSFIAFESSSPADQYIAGISIHQLTSDDARMRR